MPVSLQEHRLFPIIHPESVAIFGASNRYTAMGTVILHALLDFAFSGTVYPVHPKETEVLGLKAYPSVKDLPEVPDVALIVLPTKIVCEVLVACGEKGIRHAIVVSGGFKEAGEEGARRQEELIAIAEKYGMTMIGPNCIGVTNAYHRFNTTPHKYTCKAGFIGLASQSGSFVTQMFTYLENMKLGFSSAFSVGNEANTDIVDCLEYLGACPETKVIALYIEGLRRGRKFVETARRIVPDKPIVALYVGGSETGRQAALSHTGALSGPDELYDGIFRQAGVIRAQSLTELFDFCMALGQLPLPQGNQVFVQTHSGGPGAVASDACGRVGFTLPLPAEETKKDLSGIVPATGSLRNPVDVTFMQDVIQFFTTIPKVLIKDPACHTVLLYFYLSPAMVKRYLREAGIARDKLEETLEQVFDEVARNIRSIIDSAQKPVVCFSYQDRQDLPPRSLARAGVPFYQGPERAVQAIRALLQYRQMREKITAQSA